MKLFAHSRHMYEDRATRGIIEFAVDQVREVTDELGNYLATEHPNKFCDVTREKDPENHSCGKRKLYQTTQLAPAVTTMIVPGSGRSSKQRLDARRQTMKRSRVARVSPASRGG